MPFLFAAAPLAGAATAGAAGGAAVTAGVTGATAGITLASVLPYISAAGIGISALGQYQAGQSAQAMGEYNQEVAAQEAETIRRKTAFDIDIQRDKSRRLTSMQRLAYSKSGVDITSGTPLDVLLQQVRDAEMDVLATQYSGDIMASKAFARGAGYGYQGEQAVMAGKIGAVGSVLKGAGELYYGYGRGRRLLQESGL